MQDKVSRPRSRMVRKAILLTPEESARLKALAKAQGVSEAEILRAAVARAMTR